MPPVGQPAALLFLADLWVDGCSLPPVAPVLTGRTGVAAEPHCQDVEHTETEDDEQDNEQFHGGSSPLQDKPEVFASTGTPIRAGARGSQNGLTRGDNVLAKRSRSEAVLERTEHAGSTSHPGEVAARRGLDVDPGADLLHLRVPLHLEGGEDEFADDGVDERHVAFPFR